MILETFLKDLINFGDMFPTHKIYVTKKTPSEIQAL